MKPRIGAYAVCNDGRFGYITAVETDRYTGKIWVWIVDDAGGEFEVSEECLLSVEDKA